MRFDRRTVIKGTAAGVGASALLPGSGGAKPPSATIDDRLDTDAAGPQEIIVVFRTNEDATVLDEYDLSEGYYRFEVLPMAYTIATGGQIESLARRQSVRRITPNYELDYFNGDARRVTGADSIARDLGYDGTHGHAAVVDTGIDALHPDHQINLVNNYQWVNPLDRGTMWVDLGRADSDNNGHGSHVSGTVAGDGSRTAEHRGMAPRGTLTVYSTGATLLILNSLGAFDHLLAEKQAGHTDVQVVNNSFGSLSGYDADYDPDDPTNVASYFLYKEGILPVFAAGNCGPDGSADCFGPTADDNTLSNPAQSPWVLGVAATDDEKSVTGFSSRGRQQTDGDRIENHDRQTALKNYEEYRRSLLHPAAVGTPHETLTGLSGSGVVAGTSLEEVFGVDDVQGAIADEFTLPASPEPDDLDDVVGYYVTATLTWTPGTEPGVPEASEFEFKLLDAEGNVVRSAGTNFINGTRTGHELAIRGRFERPAADETYRLKVESSRGGGEYEVTGEVVMVNPADGFPAPDRPYSIERPSVGAPGSGLVSTTMPGDQLHDQTDGETYYSPFSGTSMASPVVTGIVTLLNDAYYEEFDEYPDVLEVIDVVESTAEYLPDETNHTRYRIGAGFVDARAAVEELLERGRAERGDDESAPAIDEFVLRPGNGNQGRWTRYDVDWAVSDADGDLSEVTTALVDGSGSVLDSETTFVGGADADGTHSVESRDQSAAEIVLKAIDESGNTTTDSESV
jgi:serine protease AprX